MGRPGKLEVVPTKPVGTQRELSLAYSPGVAEPCREIAQNPELVREYTGKGNLVAVITNGTAVLGLGDIGPLAAKPVMEGKAVLFKRYADIDVFDIEIAEKDPDKLVEVIAALEPTFGGINLEDIKAPDCFLVERALRERMKIPVFHDDQHGTAIITAAALLNACEIQGKKLDEISVTCIGAGASAVSCMELWVRFGVRRDAITLIDSKGVVRQDRPGQMDPYRAAFARPKEHPHHTLEDAITGADVLVGLSSGGNLDPKLLERMAKKPIVFALANPDPEVPYEVAKQIRPDAIVGTGRSDYPNQVNNVLGFPYIFRGALDAGATRINDEMKMAAAQALAGLAREGVPDSVTSAYGGESLRFGPEYIIPKPVDERGLLWVAPAVAKAAIDSGVATRALDIDEYRESLGRKLSPSRRVMWSITSLARREPKRVIFPEGEEDRILHAAQIACESGIAHPILIGRPAVVERRARDLGLSLDGIVVLDRDNLPKMEDYADEYWRSRRRKGVTKRLALNTLQRSRTYYGMMAVRMGDADGLVSGLTAAYPDTIRPALQIIGVRNGFRHAAGLYVVITKAGARFLADTTIKIEPDEETMAEIAILSADLVRELDIEPRVAMLSFSNFGDAHHPHSRKVAAATALVKKKRPDVMVDGEMQADVAIVPELREPYPFSDLVGPANVLIFPSLNAGNIAYKLLAAHGGDVVGPIVLGMRRPTNVLQQGASVQNIVHMTAITVANAITLQKKGLEPIE
jgi:malate dehydrogenase (oxaloacetate-decarboxylating)(NADP+)